MPPCGRPQTRRSWRRRPGEAGGEWRRESLGGWRGGRSRPRGRERVDYAGIGRVVAGRACYEETVGREMCMASRGTCTERPLQIPWVKISAATAHPRWPRDQDSSGPRRRAVIGGGGLVKGPRPRRSGRLLGRRPLTSAGVFPGRAALCRPSSPPRPGAAGAAGHVIPLRHPRPALRATHGTGPRHMEKARRPSKARQKAASPSAASHSCRPAASAVPSRSPLRPRQSAGGGARPRNESNRGPMTDMEPCQIRTRTRRAATVEHAASEPRGVSRKGRHCDRGHGAPPRLEPDPQAPSVHLPRIGHAVTMPPRRSYPARPPDAVVPGRRRPGRPALARTAPSRGPGVP